MRRFSFIILMLLPCVVCACKKDQGVGEPCLPEPIPCDEEGKNCGFKPTETYVQIDTPACEARACVVRRLDNGTDGQVPADPRVVCEEDSSEGCVPRATLEESVYCTCRCDGAKGAENRCECPDDFACTQVSADPGAAYCVRRR